MGTWRAGVEGASAKEGEGVWGTGDAGWVVALPWTCMAQQGIKVYRIATDVMGKY